MSTWILMRHARSRYNAGETIDPDSDLNERGKYQCEEAALHLKEVLGINWPNLEAPGFVGFVSPFLRTLKTAFCSHWRWNIPFIVEPRICETPSIHAVEEKIIVPNRKNGLQFSSFNWDRLPGDFDFKAVSMKKYREGMEQFVKELPEDAIIVSHMDTIKYLAEIMTGKSLSDIVISNASLTLIEDGKLIFIGKR